MRSPATVSLLSLLAALCLQAGDPQAQGPPIQVGQSYTRARRSLLAAGWRSVARKDPRQCSGDLPDRRCSLYPELASCSHTGLGLCRFQWRAPDRRSYAVITRDGNPSGDPGVVSQWFEAPP